MKKLLTCIALGFATTSYAVTPLWMRDVQISPDGTEIAFCYKGDIYKVPAKGGTATQLTTQASYECTPIWSPDGKQIAFASDRNGNFDLFVMPSNGGTAQCLTLIPPPRFHRPLLPTVNTYSSPHPYKIPPRAPYSRPRP